MQFDINKINVNSSRLNPELLDECNRLEINRQLQDPQQVNELIAEVKTLVIKEYPDKYVTLFNDMCWHFLTFFFFYRADQLDLNDEHILSVLHWASTRIKSLQQLVSGDLLFLWVLPKKGGKMDMTAGMLNENDVH